MTRGRRLVTVLLTACVALLLGAAPAFAHTRLEGSNPVDKSSVDSAPSTVSLQFNEDVQSEFAAITVVGPDGTQYQTGGVTAGGGQVSTAVSPLGPAGTYQVGYRVVSDDGHPVQGKLSFTLTAPGPGAAASASAAAAPQTAPAAAPSAAPAAPEVAPQAATQQSGGTPIWPWLVGAVVLVAAGAVVALRLGRRGD
jgi:copper resistance protein C